jgi:hypothetical protein
MKKMFAALLCFAALSAPAGRFAFAQEISGAGAAPLWGVFQKKIAIQRGVSVSAWEDRGDVSYEQYGMYAATMSPVGDGTYRIKFDLTPGTDYNFIFFAVSTAPLAGINTGLVYYDAVPSFGSDDGFVTSTSPVAAKSSDMQTGGYISIGGDARRYVSIPELDPGSTFYVFSNWASTPSAPTDFKARPGNGRNHLSWGASYGWWGTSSERYKAIDVIAGGTYVIYRSSISAEGPYEIAATTPGYCFSWTDETVTNGIRYYYAISSSDAYKGNQAGDEADVNLVSEFSSAGAPVTPGAPVPIRFRVEGIDWEVIRKNGYLAWLTPAAPPADGRGLPPARRRIPARLTYAVPRRPWPAAILGVIGL